MEKTALTFAKHGIPISILCFFLGHQPIVHSKDQVVDRPDPGVLILTKGQGGDARGAAALASHWRSKKKPDVLNLSTVGLDNIDSSAYSCLLIVGQGAADEALQSGRMLPAWKNKQIGIYSHLIDSTIVRYLESSGERLPIRFFFPQSQIDLLSKRNEKASFHLKNYAVQTAPLAIETVSEKPRSDQDSENPALLDRDVVIWLGGNYIDSSGMQRVLTTQEISESLKAVRARMKPKSTVAIVLIPRIFDSEMTAAEKSNRLHEMKKLFSQHDPIFYGASPIVKALSSETLKINPALPYDRLMQLPWTHTEHYVSADQYNVFADIGATNVFPFLLDPLDDDQRFAAMQFLLHRKQGSLSERLLRYGCK
ncbi:MAG: hypothetical protein JHC61_15545 [Burkholderiaceae bacterium]|nr:hypothetical protein [Burkholderiaceae bacterium]